VKGYLNTVKKGELHKIKILLLVALVIGFGLRLALALTMDNKISWEDESDYLDLAQKLSNGEGYVLADGSPTAFRAPGYPAFLALLRLGGLTSPLAVRIVQVLLATIMLWLVYRLGSELMNRAAGLTGAALTAIYPYYILMPATLLAETLFTILLLAALLLFHISLRTGRGTLLLCSAVLMGFAILTRPAAWALGGGILFWLLFITRYPTGQRLGLAALFFVAVLLTVAPWMTRNYVRLGSFALATNGGRNFWLGNNSAATINTGSNIVLDAEMNRNIENAAGETARERIYYDEAFRHIQNHPRQFVFLTFNKALAFWRWTPSPVTENNYARNNLLTWLSLLSVGPVFILAVAGYILVSAELRSKIYLWLIMAFFYTAIHALYISKVRFRLPLDAFMILAAAFALAQMTVKVRLLAKRTAKAS